MKRTIDTTQAAKHIAAQHGLNFVYIRGARMWKLEAVANPGFDSEHRYSTVGVQDMFIDDFYAHCAEFCALAITPAQMNIVVNRFKHSHAYDNGAQMSLDLGEVEAFDALGKASATNDRQVIAVENNIHLMLEALRETHGSYTDHKWATGALTATLDPVADDWQPEAPELTQARDTALLAQRRTVTPNTLEAATEKKCMQHIQSFLHMVGEGKGYPEAWAVIKSRSSFGPVLMADLYARCIQAARAVDSCMATLNTARMRRLGNKLVELTPEVSGKPSLHVQACTEDRIAFVVSNLSAEQAACLAEYVKNIKGASDGNLS